MRVFPIIKEKIRRAFTLIEILLSLTILAIMVLLLTSMLSNVQNVVSRSQAQVSEFEEARQAFESMSRRISQATLSSYWGYVYKPGSGGNADPSYYARLSDMHFVADGLKELIPTSTGNGQGVFFQGMLGDSDPSTPMGSEIKGLYDLVNCWGYYVDYGSDLDRRPMFMRTDANALALNPERSRFRLMEFRQPPDKSVLFSSSFNINGQTNKNELYKWFRGPFKDGGGVTADYAVPVADNILALIVSPYIYVNVGGTATADSTTDMRKPQAYLYDTRLFQWAPNQSIQLRMSSRHQLPGLVELTLIAADEKSYERLEQKYGVEPAAAKVREVFKGLLTKPIHFSKDMNPIPGTAAYNGPYDIDTIETRLNELGLHYKVFSTTVPIRASKWITERESESTGAL